MCDGIDVDVKITADLSNFYVQGYGQIPEMMLLWLVAVIHVEGEWPLQGTQSVVG